MSPYADLTLAGATMETRRVVDPLLSRELLQPRVTDYTSGHDAASVLISPLFADLSGLPPVIIQAELTRCSSTMPFASRDRPPTPTSR